MKFQCYNCNKLFNDKDGFSICLYTGQATAMLSHCKDCYILKCNHDIKELEKERPDRSWDMTGIEKEQRKKDIVLTIKEIKDNIKKANNK